jgi:hypothetical protein
MIGDDNTQELMNQLPIGLDDTDFINQLPTKSGEPTMITQEMLDHMKEDKKKNKAGIKKRNRTPFFPIIPKLDKREDREPNQHFIHKPVTDKLYGIPKLDGTNASIVRKRGSNELTFRSRYCIITSNTANFQFKPYCEDTYRIESIHHLFDEIEKEENYDEITIYGEYCGKDIQHGYHKTRDERVFAIFAIKCDDTWQDMRNFTHIQDTSNEIYNLWDVKVYTIDCNDTMEEEIKKVLEEVKTCCPFSVLYGSKQPSRGEGVVWYYNMEDESKLCCFKTVILTPAELKSQIKTSAATEAKANDLDVAAFADCYNTMAKEEGIELTDVEIESAMKWYIKNKHNF